MYIGGAQPECRVLAEIEKFKFSIISTPRKGFESVKVLIQTGTPIRLFLETQFNVANKKLH